jgi:hypothetical protein
MGQEDPPQQKDVKSAAAALANEGSLSGLVSRPDFKSGGGRRKPGTVGSIPTRFRHVVATEFFPRFRYGFCLFVRIAFHHGQDITLRTFSDESVLEYPSVQALPARTRKNRICPGAGAVVLVALGVR